MINKNGYYLFEIRRSSIRINPFAIFQEKM